MKRASIIATYCILVIAAPAANAQPIKLSDIFSSYRSLSDIAQQLLLTGVDSGISSGADTLLGNARSTLGSDPLLLLQFDQVKPSLKTSLITSMDAIWSITLGTAYSDLTIKADTLYAPDSATTPITLIDALTPVRYTLDPLFSFIPASAGDLTEYLLSGDTEALLNSILSGTNVGIGGDIHFGNTAELGVNITSGLGSNLIEISPHFNLDWSVIGDNYDLTIGISAHATLSSENKYNPTWSASGGVVCHFSDPDCKYSSIDEPGILSMLLPTMFAFYVSGRNRGQCGLAMSRRLVLHCGNRQIIPTQAARGLPR